MILRQGCVGHRDHRHAGAGGGAQAVARVLDGDALAKIGGQAQRGSVIGQILARDQDTTHDAARAVLDALDWPDEPGKAPPLIHDVIHLQRAT